MHGFTGNPRTSTPFAKALQAAGFSVDVPRLPGHGTTWEDMALTGYADWRREAEQGLDRLKKTCEHVFVTGLSMGGTLSVDLSWERPGDISGAIPVNATVMPREGLVAKVAPYVSKLVKSIPAKMAGLMENDSAKPFDEQAYSRIPTAAANSLLAELPRIKRCIPEIRVPMLVAYSPQDHSVPVDNSQELLAKVDGAEELVLPNSYHLATVDLDAELLYERTIAFIDKVRNAA